MRHKREFDVFIVYTDSEIGCRTMHTAEALRQYREYSKINDARLIVVGMVSNGSRVSSFLISSLVYSRENGITSKLASVLAVKSTIAKDASNAVIPDDPKTGLCIDPLTSIIMDC
jgi:hypothetical protein